MRNVPYIDQKRQKRPSDAIMQKTQKDSAKGRRGGSRSPRGPAMFTKTAVTRFAKGLVAAGLPAERLRFVLDPKSGKISVDVRDEVPAGEGGDGSGIADSTAAAELHEW